jgi:hypothetical protein
VVLDESLLKEGKSKRALPLFFISHLPHTHKGG